MGIETLAGRLAFNLGCDARLAGKPMSACPYTASTCEYLQWRRGWADVDKSYGVWARKRGWQVRPLPPVQGKIQVAVEVTGSQ